MKWTEEELIETINLLKNGKTYEEISKITGRPKNAIRVKLGKLGETYSKYNPKQVKHCLECNNEITKHGIKFCSHSCSATHNNKLRGEEKVKFKSHNKLDKIICLNCDSEITTNRRKVRKYCSQKCQHSYNEKQVFKKIEGGDTTLYFKNYKKYLIDKHGEECMDCGWCEINPHSGKIPIELEHIDGDSTNNSLDNLKLLCPNCHSLTPTYKALNMGNGRHKRRERYKNNQSF